MEQHIDGPVLYTGIFWNRTLFHGNAVGVISEEALNVRQCSISGGTILSFVCEGFFFSALPWHHTILVRVVMEVFYNELFRSGPHFCLLWCKLSINETVVTF